MTKLRLVVAPLARADLSDHRRWIVENAGERVARDVLRLIRNRIEQLQTWPFTGVSRPEYGQGVRSSPVGSYVIYHEADHERLSILRVLHALRDHEQILGRKGGI